MIKGALIIVSVCLISLVNAQNIENGIYISFKGGVVPKYAILTVKNDSANVEVYTKWQGEWLPAVGTWNKSYKPQRLFKNENGTLTNENAIVERKKYLKGFVKNSFVGKIKLKFEKVEKLPKEYEEVRQKAIEFVNRKE